jgi:predicted O-methyltransferase YrrM
MRGLAADINTLRALALVVADQVLTAGTVTTERHQWLARALEHARKLVRALEAAILHECE